MNSRATRYRVPSQILSQEVSGESVLLDLKTEVYFGLNATGTLVWQALVAGKSPNEIVEMLQTEFPIAAIAAQRDLDRFLDDLLDRGLLERG